MNSHIREDLSRNEKVQQARRVLNENKFSLEAWAILIQDAQDKKIADSRDFYEQLVAQFSTCGKFWKIYIESEMKGRNYERVEKLFQRCLIKVLNIDLWKCYLNYVKDTKGKLQEKMAQAYDFALEKIGLDVFSYTIWNDYVNFLKSVEAVGSYAENQKITAVRKVYQKGVMTPMTNIELLWKDYCSYEMSINSMLAKKIIEDRSRDYLNVKRVTKELETMTRSIDRNIPCILPLAQTQTEELKQLQAWKKYIQWEKSNPLKSDDHLLVTKRCMFAYEQCLLCLGYHSDIWYDAGQYLESIVHHFHDKGDIQLTKKFLDDTSQLYERSISLFMKQNQLIHYSYADFEESRLNYDKVRKIYQKLVEIDDSTFDPTLAYIHYMSFERRCDGIKSARAIFKKAREDQRTQHHIYVAAALMEYYCTKDNTVAFNIFNLGLKKYGQNVDYILAYIDYMTHLNEDHNARVLFERVLSSDNQIPKQNQSDIWYEFLKFESNVGDLSSIKKVEKRRNQLYQELNEFDGKETLLLIDRYKFLNLLPCNYDELKILGYNADYLHHQHHHTNSKLTNGNGIHSDLFQIKTTDRYHKIHSEKPNYPKPDIKHMMPYRPTRNALPGSHPTPGGVFPLPDTALYLVKVLPPPRNFEGPFVIIDELMEKIAAAIIPDTYEPIRITINGEAIRENDMNARGTNTKKTSGGHDSDEEDQINSQSAPPMDVYRRRQQKRAKLTNDQQQPQ
ncbi:unnamed protein product [Didymodactylos carnosus]|uniref:Suppressor of forked domain-containing protein n=1 Tax=Didymodactylos carnosus TaxID=1234261 RepID=A0A813T9D2_9BILA|nr:unnamed protein product [Didymodactylos carnosus]CAF3591984.1 unnamed protein product [Didymodactylos carnosus]